MTEVTIYAIRAERYRLSVNAGLISLLNLPGKGLVMGKEMTNPSSEIMVSYGVAFVCRCTQNSVTFILESCGRKTREIACQDCVVIHCRISNICYSGQYHSTAAGSAESSFFAPFTRITNPSKS